MGLALADLHRRVSDLERREGDRLRLGRVAAVAPDYRVRLDLGPKGEPQLTGWVAVFAPRAGAAVVASPPSLGERCLLIAVSDTVQVALAALYGGKARPPEDVPDGMVWVGGELRVKGRIVATEGVFAAGAVVAQADVPDEPEGSPSGGVSLADHKHRYTKPAHPAGQASTTKPA